MYKRIKSSFHGKIDELPGVYVDNFEYTKNKGVQAFFLSHYHSDHIQGLYSTELLETLKESKVNIYTTELTATIIENEKQNEMLIKHIKRLKTGSTTITLPGTKSAPEIFLTVTLIPAGHCAGSTMFLFKTPFKSILYTGDFRINCNDLPNYISLHENGEPVKLDCLYVDTTFIYMEYENFPKRSECVDIIVCEIRKWLGFHDNAVSIYTPAKYGYEFLFNEIYNKLNRKVYVDSKKWKIYSKVPHLVPGVTNDKNETQIHLCRHRQEQTSHIKCIDNKYNRFLHIYLSAMKWTYCKDEFCAVDRVSPTCIHVCFATHCSRKELLHFVKYLTPNKIIGFPNSFNEIPSKRAVDYDMVKENKKTRVDKKVDVKLLKLMFD